MIRKIEKLRKTQNNETNWIKLMTKVARKIIQAKALKKEGNNIC